MCVSYRSVRRVHFEHLIFLCGALDNGRIGAAPSLDREASLAAAKGGILKLVMMFRSRSSVRVYLARLAGNLISRVRVRECVGAMSEGPHGETGSRLKL